MMEHDHGQQRPRGEGGGDVDRRGGPGGQHPYGESCGGGVGGAEGVGEGRCWCCWCAGVGAGVEAVHAVFYFRFFCVLYFFFAVAGKSGSWDSCAVNFCLVVVLPG